jgi:hypothetical protein
VRLPVAAATGVEVRIPVGLAMRDMLRGVLGMDNNVSIPSIDQATWDAFAALHWLRHQTNFLSFGDQNMHIFLYIY